MDLQYTDNLPFVLLSVLFSSVLFVLVAKSAISRKSKNVPPGRLGLPLIGETIPFIKARKAHKSHKWVEEKVAKYGPVFKTSLLGCPTVFLTGPAGNRFLFQTDNNSVINTQPTNFLRILGHRNVFSLSGEDHKRIRGAVMTFMKPEELKKSVGRIDSAVRQHLAACWQGKDRVTVRPLMKKLSFDIACDLLFGLKDSEERRRLGDDFNILVKGVWTLPLNWPGTPLRKAVHARSRICKRLSSLFETRKKEIQQGKVSPSEDMISCLLSMEDENNKWVLTEEEIVDNVIAAMIAGHDTTAALLTNIVRMLALNPHVSHKLLLEQKEILATKQPDEALSWEDMKKMKYTWKVAQETLRLYPSALGGFRKAVKDVEYEGYVIPKGWQLFWITSYTHMEEDVFEQAETFDPCRFDVGIPPYVFLPFGGGSRICPGYDFAKIETMVFLHYLVRTYEWFMVIPEEKITCDPLPAPQMGLPINITPR